MQPQSQQWQQLRRQFARVRQCVHLQPPLFDDQMRALPPLLLYQHQMEGRIVTALARWARWAGRNRARQPHTASDPSSPFQRQCTRLPLHHTRVELLPQADG